ncbi:SH2 domain-containing adapter protein F-like isoform X2 [Narcine bancroftii]|uniref:SH2 domain-containing adapter protein F-like isoform X2 n=1 Tax=Narcine bancroftii TaxID=1343680 RepID=UPI0038313F24
MAKWFKEHLSFKSNKAPPQPPKPDYRLRPGGQPDILAAYKMQKERDFEDPYTGSRGAPPGSCPLPGAAPELRSISPKHRLIKVENPEKGCGKAASSPEDHQGKVIILEDYADPFDVQSGQEKVVGNDGYMEPYEAQRMMAEIRRRGSKDGPGKSLPLYDTPYEPTENGGDSDAERTPCPRPRESRLPEDDERPPGEYDQPWEWKKERISKAFAVEIKVIKELPWPPPVGQLDSVMPGPEGEMLPAHSHVQHQLPLEDTSVQFDDVDKDRQSPSKEEKIWQHHRLSGPSLKSLKHQSLELSGPLGERVEPDLPLVSQIWYHGAISRTDAENLLRLCKEASYLVRNSETTKNDYSLSLNRSAVGFLWRRSLYSSAGRFLQVTENFFRNAGGT